MCVFVPIFSILTCVHTHTHRHTSFYLNLISSFHFSLRVSFTNFLLQKKVSSLDGREDILCEMISQSSNKIKGNNNSKIVTPPLTTTITTELDTGGQNNIIKQ